MSSPAPLESIRFCILLALAKEPMSGSAIQNQIMIDSRGAGIYLQPTTIYKTLKRLQELKLVEQHEGTPTNRPTYKLTLHARHILKLETARLRDATDIARQRLTP